MLVLLPGMDGTGTLFNPFLECLPKAYEVKILHYPADTYLTYEQLEAYPIKDLPVGKPFTIIAESFSGPIALRLANRTDPNLRAVVLVCSFAFCPLGSLGSWLARLPLGMFLRLHIPNLLLRIFLLDGTASTQLLHRTRVAIRSVELNVMACRLREALTTRYCAEPIGSNVPIFALFSSKDRLLGHKAGRSILQVFNSAQLHRINAPHFAMQVAPTEVVRALIAFGILNESDYG